MSDEILCVGEILWDALPAGLFLGGAPFNVACHLQALGRRAYFASRVGSDRLGIEARRRLPAYGLDDTLLQTDEELPTGFVEVALDAGGEAPGYDIVEPAAWDAIACTDALDRAARSTDALVFGTLAQRADTSRTTIEALCEADVLRIFDVNLRPPYVQRSVVECSLSKADVVKLNEDEYRQLAEWFGLAEGDEVGLSQLASDFDCDAVCVTRGGNGACLWWKGEYLSRSGYTAEVEDTVGAGDAFLAALLSGLMNDHSGPAVLDLANRLGAHVASRPGALPAYDVSNLTEIQQLALPN